MTSLLARKAKTFFKHIDVHDHGYISLKDYIAIGDRNCDAEKANDVQRERSKECFHRMWRKFTKSAGSGDNALMTPSICAESIVQQRNDPDFKEAWMAICRQYFELLDANGDGFLQEDEYARAFANGGLKDLQTVRRAFDAIDLNKDEKLSIEEFSIALTEYFTSVDESNRYNGLWGPLVD